MTINFLNLTFNRHVSSRLSFPFIRTFRSVFPFYFTVSRGHSQRVNLRRNFPYPLYDGRAVPSHGRTFHRQRSFIFILINGHRRHHPMLKGLSVNNAGYFMRHFKGSNILSSSLPYKLRFQPRCNVSFLRFVRARGQRLRMCT